MSTDPNSPSFGAPAGDASGNSPRARGRAYPGEDPGIRDVGPGEWLRGVGTVRARSVCAAAAVDYNLFRQVARGVRALSLAPAVRLTLASNGGVALAGLLGPEDAAAIDEWIAWTVERRLAGVGAVPGRAQA